MVKYTQTILRLLLTNCLSVFDHFVGLVLKGLRSIEFWTKKQKGNKLHPVFFSFVFNLLFIVIFFNVSILTYFWVWRSRACANRSLLNFRPKCRRKYRNSLKALLGSSLILNECYNKYNKLPEYYNKYNVLHLKWWKSIRTFQYLYLKKKTVYVSCKLLVFS